MGFEPTKILIQSKIYYPFKIAVCALIYDVGAVICNKACSYKEII